MRTNEEIKTEIAALEACKSYAPSHTAFGDDNHAKIDIQLSFLRDEIDEYEMDTDDYTDGERDAVMEAKQWRDSDSDEAPSAGWDIFKKQ